MNKQLTTVAILAATLVVPSLLPTSYADIPTEVAKPMDKRSSDFNFKGADSEWLKSWHSNEIYLVKSEYYFDGYLKQIPNEQARWFARWTAKGVDAVADVIERGSFAGKAISTTVVSHEQPLLRMVRDYKYVDGKGTWVAEVLPDSEAVKNSRIIPHERKLQ